MSAYVCSDATFAALAKYFAGVDHYYTKPANREQIQHLAYQLKAWNIDSVNYRYNEEQEHEPCELGQLGEYPREPVTILKLCSCLEYQACERDDWKTFPAYEFLEQVKSVAISHLPGWDSAPWGLE